MKANTLDLLFCVNTWEENKPQLDSTKLNKGDVEETDDKEPSAELVGV